MPQSLTYKTIHSIKWNYISTLVNSILQIAYTAVMARLLLPRAFGLVAMASVILNFGSYFAQMGMGQALIQKKELTDQNIRAAFTSSLLLSLFFFGLLWILSPLATLIFDDKLIIPIIRVLAISLLLNGLATTSLSMLRRDLRFKQLAIITIISYIISYLGIGIILALLGLGVWSLVFATLSQAFIRGILAYLVVKHNVKLVFSWDHYKPLFSFGGKISIISFLEFISQSLPTLFIGKTLGSFLLGIYNRAYNIINLPMYYLTTSLSNVLFSSFSNKQNEKEKLTQAFLTTITFVSLLVIPLGIGISIAANQIILIVLGERWVQAIPILHVLALAIPFSMLMHFGGVLCDATAYLNVKLLVQSLYVILFTGLMVALGIYGLKGFAYAILIGEFVRFIAYIFIEKRILTINISRILMAFRPGFFTGVLVGTFLYLLTTFLTYLKLTVPYIFIFQLVVGASFLFIILLFWGARNYKTQKLGNFLRPILKPNHILYLEILINKIRVKFNWD